MTTAEFRKMAMECEAKFDWKVAAAYWDLAASRYPQTTGELAIRDKSQMMHRSAECRYMAMMEA